MRLPCPTRPAPARRSLLTFAVPFSTLFGSEAIGALAQIMTKRGGPPPIDALVESGGQGTARAAVGRAGVRVAAGR